MKVLLIQPPIRDFYQTSTRTQPIGLAYLAASLKRHGHEVGILDAQIAKKRSIPVPPELSYLRELYPFSDRSPFKLYTGYYHFGMGWDEINGCIRASGADVFGISSSFTPYHGEALEIARLIKAWDTDKTVVMGGSHVSCDPEGVLKSPLVDYVVVGEGEIRFPLLLEELEKGTRGAIDDIDGIGYREHGQSRTHLLRSFIQDLDSLPHPARDLLEPDRYRLGKRRSTMLITSRGCPHRCAYCSAPRVMGQTFRTRSPEKVLEEMVECRDRFGVRVFDIEDDNFTLDQERAKRLMSLIVETFGEEELELTAMNGVSFASLDQDLLILMKRAGFRTLNLSLVSLDLPTKMRMARPGLSSDFGGILREVEAAGLGAIVYAILGMPGQTVEEMVDTLLYLMGKRVLIGPSVYYPVPGTPLFDTCRSDARLPVHPSQWRSSALPVETKEFDRLDLVTLLRLTRVVNFLKGEINKGEMPEGVTLGEIGRVLRERKGRLAEGEVDWRDLLCLLVEERAFCRTRSTGTGKISLAKEKSSKRVLDSFFDRGWRTPVLKSRLDPKAK